MKAYHDNTDEKILVTCFTNQALDQTIQDIRKAGIADSQIVRLGGLEKTDPGNASLLLSTLRKDDFSTLRSRAAQGVADDAEKQASRESWHLQRLFLDLQSVFTSLDQVHKHLDGMTAPDERKYSDALGIPKDAKTTNRNYLLQRWVLAHNYGVCSEKQQYTDVWNMPHTERKELLHYWRLEIAQEKLIEFQDRADRHDDLLDQANNALRLRDEILVQGKRIIACTTSNAAKYSVIQTAAPGIIFVEEAGEILESHIVTALNPHAKQLVMIGDHKQLRPKVNYKLQTQC